MRITTALIGFLIYMNTMAQERTTPALACNLGAISAAERPKYSALAKRLKAAMSDRRELADGYGFTLLAIPAKPNTVPKGRRTGFRAESEQQSERSDAGVLIVG